MTVDRSTIKSHLLSDTKDPFNRSPLSIDDVVPGDSCFTSCPFSIADDIFQILN